MIVSSPPAKKINVRLTHSIPYNILVAKPEWLQPLGRSRRGWKRSGKEHGVTVRTGFIWLRTGFGGRMGVSVL
jgi:hypothetical protein